MLGPGPGVCDRHAAAFEVARVADVLTVDVDREHLCAGEAGLCPVVVRELAVAICGSGLDGEPVENVPRIVGRIEHQAERSGEQLPAPLPRAPKLSGVAAVR